jgi:adenylylsulfate kinase
MTPGMTPGTIVWFTGLPASGKSTLAARVHAQLTSHGRTAVVLDSDALRDALGAHAYDDAARDEQYRVLAALAVMLADQGVSVLVAATAPRRAHREQARAGHSRVHEVWVRASRETCEARDVKGLYARARTGELAHVPGVDVDYEPPEHPAVIAIGGHDDRAVLEICALLPP